MRLDINKVFQHTKKRANCEPARLAPTTGRDFVSEARDENQNRWWMSRRAFLSSGAAAGIAAAALGGAGAERVYAAPANDIDAIVLQVAAAIAVFPIPFETYESEPAVARLTAQRLERAWGRTSAARVEQAERGAQLLLDRELGGVGTEELLAKLAAVAAVGNERDLADLKALAAVAGAVLADRIDPNDDHNPNLWFGGLAIMHRNGEKPVVGD